MSAFKKKDSVEELRTIQENYQQEILFFEMLVHPKVLFKGGRRRDCQQQQQNQQQNQQHTQYNIN